MLQKIILLILLFSLSYCKKYISVTMATATSVNSGLPFDLFEGKVWKADENAGFVKMHIYPDEPIILSRIELQSCEKDFEPLEVFINFDEFIRSPERKGKNASIKFASPVTARSVTFNFEKNIGVCLNSLKLFDDKDKQVYLKGPNIVEGTVKASETSSPESSYSVMNMFDSRFEDAYASKKGAKGVTFDFSFEDSQKIESIKIWNGYQRSDIHCIENGRIKSLTLKAENYEETVSVEDEMGGQIIKLPKPFKGKKFQLIVSDFYKGKKAKGIVISEMRFFDGSQWFTLDPLPKMKSTIEKNKVAFSTAGVINILDGSIKGFDSVYTGDEVGGRDESNWIFRFRSDGSMFLEGHTVRIDRNYNEEEGTVTNSNQDRRFFGLGNYEVKSAEGQRLSVRIFGFLRDVKVEDNSTEEIHGDCNGCGRDCNKVYSPESGKVEKIFQEYLDVELDKTTGKIKIKNQKKTRHLDFDELEMKNSI